MTELEIMNLAYHAQLERWGKEKEISEKLPDNEIARNRERNAWNKLQWISNRLFELERA